MFYCRLGLVSLSLVQSMHGIMAKWSRRSQVMCELIGMQSSEARSCEYMQVLDRFQFRVIVTCMRGRELHKC